MCVSRKLPVTKFSSQSRGDRWDSVLPCRRVRQSIRCKMTVTSKKRTGITGSFKSPRTRNTISVSHYRTGSASRSAFWCGEQYTTWHHVISKNCASQFRLVANLAALRSMHCSRCFGRPKNTAATRQPGILCGWSGRLEQSPNGYSFCTYIINLQKHVQDTTFLTFLLHWLTVSRVRAANFVRRPLVNRIGTDVECKDLDAASTLLQLWPPRHLISIRTRRWPMGSANSPSPLCWQEAAENDARWHAETMLASTRYYYYYYY